MLNVIAKNLLSRRLTNILHDAIACIKSLKISLYLGRKLSLLSSEHKNFPDLVSSLFRHSRVMPYTPFVMKYGVPGGPHSRRGPKLGFTSRMISPSFLDHIFSTYPARLNLGNTTPKFFLCPPVHQMSKPLLDLPGTVPSVCCPDSFL